MARRAALIAAATDDAIETLTWRVKTGIESSDNSLAVNAIKITSSQKTVVFLVCPKKCF